MRFVYFFERRLHLLLRVNWVKLRPIRRASVQQEKPQKFGVKIRKESTEKKSLHLFTERIDFFSWSCAWSLFILFGVRNLGLFLKFYSDLVRQLLFCAKFLSFKCKNFSNQISCLKLVLWLVSRSIKKFYYYSRFPATIIKKYSYPRKNE